MQRWLSRWDGASGSAYLVFGAGKRYLSRDDEGDDLCHPATLRPCESDIYNRGWLRVALGMIWCFEFGRGRMPGWGTAMVVKYKLLDLALGAGYAARCFVVGAGGEGGVEPDLLLLGIELGWWD